MRADLVVRNIGELVTFHSGPLRRPTLEAAGVLRGALVAVRGGRIAWVGRESEAPDFKAGTVIDAGGRLVTPALVDPHTHLVFAGDRWRELWMKLEGRSYAEILEAGLGIYYTVEQTRRVGDGELERLALERLELMLRLGTGVVEVKTGYSLDVEGELRLLRVIGRVAARARQRVVATLLAHVPPRGADPRGYAVEFAGRAVPEAARLGAEYVDVFCDRGAFGVGEARVIVEAALRHGLRVRLHSEELADIGCHRLALEYPIDSLDHLEHLPPEAVGPLAERGVTLTLLPTSMLSIFAEKRPPVGEMRRRGAYIALASDFNPNNMNPSLQDAMDLAVYLLGLTPIEALAAATVNAARSLNLHGRLGSIAPGMEAYLAVWSLDSASKLGYYWGYNRVEATITPRGCTGECGGLKR